MDGGTVETVADVIFWGPKSLQMVIATMELKSLLMKVKEGSEKVGLKAQHSEN